MRFFDRSLQDVRFAMRSMKRSPGFFGIAVLVLALGIGMSTAIITVLHTVVLRDLPVPNPDDLVVLYAEDLSRGFDHVPLLHSMFEEYAGAARVFESVAGLQYAGAWPLDFKDGDRVIRATGVLVTGDFFETLGGRATQGRTLQRSDYDLGAEPTIVISHAMWERDFTADPSVVGRRLQLVFSDHLVLTVVGVMPPAFNLPGGADYGGRAHERSGPPSSLGGLTRRSTRRGSTSSKLAPKNASRVCRCERKNPEPSSQELGWGPSAPGGKTSGFFFSKAKEQSSCQLVKISSRLVRVTPKSRPKNRAIFSILRP